MSPPRGDDGVSLRDVFLLLGETRGDVRGISERVVRVEADQKLLGVACQDIGKQIALITDEHVRRGKRISEMEHRLNCAENTGEHIVIEERARWGTIKFIAALLVSLLGAAGVAVGIWSSCKKEVSHAGQNRRVVVYQLGDGGARRLRPDQSAQRGVAPLVRAQGRGPVVPLAR